MRKTMLQKFYLGAVASDTSLGQRQIRVIASDPTPDRVKDVVVPGGCRLESYRKNPVVLADHDRTAPIGTADVEIKQGRVEALISFAPEGISAKADEYCGLAKAGILNAVSVGFAPISFEQIKGGGTRYTAWDLLEISLVAVPANPEALVVGRSLGDGGESMKSFTSSTLPLLDKQDWNPEAAAERIFAEAGFDTDRPNTKWARKAFLFHDESAPKSKASYFHPIADVVDGRLVAIKQALDAAREVCDASCKDMSSVKTILDAYQKGKRAIITAATKTFVPKIKSLYDLAYLGEILMCLGWAYDSERFWEESEGEPSKILPMLAEALQLLAAAFLEMSAEEIAELLAARATSKPATEGGAMMMAAGRGLVVKAGRKISSENMDCLGKAMACMDEAKGHIMTVCDKADQMADDESEKQAAYRLREAEVLRLAAA